ncbi:MAG: hypothetical protein JNK02_06720 [Planctomycetes bacterium]|nr:hypothetical protein [Planctomycetota bacterium]
MHKLSAALLALLALTVPITAVEESPEPAPIDVGISVTGTRFYARNYSGTSYVLLFKSGSTVIWRTLSSGHDLVWEYPTQLLSGVELEVATWADGAWRRTGSILLENVAARGTEALWVQSDSKRTSWAELGSALFVEDTGASFFPATLPSDSSLGSSAEEAFAAPTHVPVITPSENPVGDVPPRIEERPLPPV